MLYSFWMPNSSPTLFPATRWSLLQRVRGGTIEEKQAALNILCRAYWYPLYIVARRKQLNEHDAQDAVQGFFESVLRLETFSIADEAAGKLRQLLLGCFNHFCGQQQLRATRQKRGGGAEHLEFTEAIDIELAEQRYQQADTSASIEALYARAWAGAVMERSLDALREDYFKRGWHERYELLVGPLLQNGEDATLAQIAASSGTTPGALRVTLHRMRGHFRDRIERELAETLGTDDPRLIRGEMVELFKAFA